MFVFLILLASCLVILTMQLLKWKYAVNSYKLVCINVVLLMSLEHPNNGQILHQNHNEEDGRTPRPLC